MIELYTGTPGSGKSYHACDRIWWRLRRGRKVIANFPVKEDKVKHPECFTFVPNDKLTVPYLLKYAKENHAERKESQTLVVIDEAGHVFNSRDWNSKGRMLWLNFFALHRHFGFDFVLVAQQDIMVDKQIRSLIEFEVRHRNTKSSGLVSIVLMFAGNFLAIRTYYGNKYRLGSEFLRYHRRIGEIYDTFALFDDQLKLEAVLKEACDE